MKAQKQIHKTSGGVAFKNVQSMQKLSQKIHLLAKVFKIDSGIFLFIFY